MARNLLLLLNLSAYFVKNYLGLSEETLAISNYLEGESGGEWERVFQEWLRACPPEIFRLSPRALNAMYSAFTRDCQIVSPTKNYNRMVDSILQLSTTYSMMPSI